MDQLVPASYLQLEDTVRNLAIQMRVFNQPPVLTYKELRYIRTHKHQIPPNLASTSVPSINIHCVCVCLSLSRELVFADFKDRLICQHSADRELEQAIRFLHDNGTLLHYEDPLLDDFYFVDPQWLCDMLAHIITVREINPFVKEGEPN